jgi:hypothetical protein
MSTQRFLTLVEYGIIDLNWWDDGSYVDIFPLLEFFGGADTIRFARQNRTMIIMDIPVPFSLLK